MLETILSFVGTGLLPFFGGTTFRMIWGEVAAWFTKRQDHRQEIERLELQRGLADQAHAHSMDMARLHSELGLNEIRVQSEADLTKLDAQTFGVGVAATITDTGVSWVDAWNATIRPGVATWAVVLLTLEAFTLITNLSPDTKAVAFSALGLFLADRNLAKRGK